MANILIDGKEYALDSLSDASKAHIVSINAVDVKLASYQTEIALFQTARNAYLKELAASLPEKTAHPNKKKDVIVIDDKKFDLEDFSDRAKELLASYQVSEQKIAETQTHVAITQTARNAYSQELTKLLANG